MMLSKGIYRGIAAFVFLIIGSATSQSVSPVSDVAKANVLFSLDLYKVLREVNPGNLICSPLSLSAVIAMVKAGAQGKTSDEIQRSLHFPDNPTLFAGYKSLLESFKKTNENFTLEIANRVYASKGFEMNPEFENTITKNFHAEVEQLNFADSATSANKINGWVEEVTRNKIKNLISPGDLDALTRLVLVNGIYFKGNWKTQFDPKRTKKAQFFTDSKNSVDVDMMNVETEFPYADIKELDAKAIAIPYQADRLYMLILLPNQRDGLSNMESLMKNFNLSSISTRLDSRKVDLQMPKFKLESTLQLNEPLMKLGLKSMFDQSTADFGGIPKDSKSEPLYVSKVIQKAFIEVNEEGSEAAAATGRTSDHLLQPHRGFQEANGTIPKAAAFGHGGGGHGHGGGHGGGHGHGHSSGHHSSGGFSTVGHTGGGGGQANVVRSIPQNGNATTDGLTITLKSAIPATVKQFIMDHPFMAIIQDKDRDTETYLFMTTVTSPTNETHLRSIIEDRSLDGGASGGHKTGLGLFSLGLLYILKMALLK